MPTLQYAGLLGLLALLITQVLGSSNSTCSADSPCYQGCCSKSGNCGFGPDFCGEDVCISSCDAVAECGQYAPAGSESCPLNVCCSEFGYCGTTEEFCGAGCQNGCGSVNRPSCTGTSSDARYMGYYESWSPNKPCDVVRPSDINVAPWTHLYYSFALIDPSTSKITTMDGWDQEFYVEFNDLKKRKPGLKTFISVGGWDAGGKIFSDMARFPGTRSAFISSAIALMEQYGFDGIDIDWEYPAAADRDGNAADTANFVKLLSELQTACAGKYGITATLPSSYWYLKGFDIVGMSQYVDWFNFMSYDIHGTWDGSSQWTNSVVNPHTNLTEISAGLDLLWRNNIDPAKVALGLGFYGRSFTLKDVSCTTPGCAFANDTGLGGNAGGADPGTCTGTSGILSDYEISRILDQASPEVAYDATAGVNWMTWNSNQWVSYDDAKTLLQKRDFANSHCLSGTFAWALDLGGPGTKSDLANMDPNAGMAGASTDGSDSGSGNVYIGPEIYTDPDPTIACVPPCNFIFPPLILPSPTTIVFPSYPTSIEVVWPTSAVVTGDDGAVTTTTTLARIIQNTTLFIPPITTTAIDAWNWNITGLISGQAYTPSSSILPPPFYITNGYPSTLPGTTPVTRPITPPPYPWTSDTENNNPFPTVSFGVGPPGPLCTAGCGHQCHLFCAGRCETDCTDGGTDFYDPEDPDPPAKPGCRGPDCHNGKCTGPKCIYVGCDGDDCTSGICTGPKCHVVACSGNDCGTDGNCKGSSCQNAGCTGAHCNGSGGCFGLDCFSFGCWGVGCGNDHVCIEPGCREVTCSGPNCQYGVCTGSGCTSGGEEDGCSDETKANDCTEYVKSTKVGGTLSTTTSTHCQTITACSAQPTTTTTTISSNGVTDTQTEGLFPPQTGVDWASIRSRLSSELSSWDSVAMSGKTTTTTTTTTTSTTTTTTSPTPSETSYDCNGSIRCGSFANLRSFCDMAKSFLVETTIYGTKKTDYDTGTCYTDGKNLGFGCGVFVEGDDCEMTGDEMAAAYDHLHQSTGGDCGICGHVHFSNGCTLTTNYVSACQTTNSGLVPIVGINGTAVSVNGVIQHANVTLPSQSFAQSLTLAVLSSGLP